MNMKTIFRRNTNEKDKRKKILIGVLIALILAVVVFRDFSFRILSQPFFYAAHPLFKFKKNFGEWKNKIENGFAEKNLLSEENKILREKMMDLETKISLLKNLEKENDTLKSVFSSEGLNRLREDNKFILASIIYRPPFTPFDFIIIDSGSENGIEEGMIVSAFGNVLLGYTEDIFTDSSKIKMISSFGEETNVILEFSQTPAIAFGRGAENLEITLPKAVAAEIGERVMTLGKYPLLVGFIERIERQTTDPYQKIILRLPVNIQYLGQVFIFKK